LVVFDSLFGSTEVVARAIAEVLSLSGPARALRVGEIEPGHLDGVTLLVVGSPGRSSRPTAGILGWLGRLPPGRLEGVAVAAFDTRIDATSSGHPLAVLMRRWFGHPAEALEGRLLSLGGERAAPAAGFVVVKPMGPLRDGETDRAREWARSLQTP
jgi:flavodoxin